MLTGGVANAADAEQAMLIAKGYGGDGAAVDNQMSIASPTQITVMVRVAEMKRSIVRNLGIDWSAQGFFGRIAPLFGVPGAATHLLQATFNGTQCATGQGCLDAVLNALAKDGLAHLLAEPNLTVMSGQPASFQAGGEYPYPVLSGSGTGGGSGTVSIAFKPYGVLLNFVATVLSDGRINLHIKPEVSQLDTTNLLSVQTGASVSLSAPALIVRRAETTVELGSGESLAIAGMLQTTNGDNTAGIPGIGEVPVLGALFRTNNLTREQTELVIIVTPVLSRPVRNIEQLRMPGDGYKPLTDVDRVLLSRQVPNADGSTAPRGQTSQAGFIVR
jgi:pilus assembly protein CpaC